jgi:hypothetical protein
LTLQRAVKACVDNDLIPLLLDPVPLDAAGLDSRQEKLQAAFRRLRRAGPKADHGLKLCKALCALTQESVVLWHGLRSAGPYLNESNVQGDVWSMLKFLKNLDFASEHPLPSDDAAAVVGRMRADFAVWSATKKALAVVELKNSKSDAPNAKGLIKTSEGSKSFEQYVAEEHLEERVRRACEAHNAIPFHVANGVFVMAFANGTFRVHIRSYLIT